MEEDEYDKSDMNTAIKGYSTVEEAVHEFAASRINLWILATMPNRVWENSAGYKLLEDPTADDKEAHYSRRIAWHEFVLLIRNRKVFHFRLFSDISTDILIYRHTSSIQTTSIPMLRLMVREDDWAISRR